MPKPRIQTLQPRIKELPPRIPTMPRKRSKTLSERRAETGRTLALNGAAWRRLRASVLSEQPLCEHCIKRGFVVSATDVDHVNGDPTDNSRDNLAALCHECHSRKTMGGKLGCDAQGMPLDPAHPWFQKSPATEAHEPHGVPRFTANPEGKP